jgi:hypothetical protein
VILYTDDTDPSAEFHGKSIKKSVLIRVHL